jgi:hypothetical protein
VLGLGVSFKTLKPISFAKMKVFDFRLKVDSREVGFSPECKANEDC